MQAKGVIKYLMTDIWKKIEQWIKDNHPAMMDTLNPGATEEDFLKFQSIVGIELPDDFKNFLSIHNGQTWTHLKLFNGDRLLSIDDILHDWNSWKDVLPAIDAQCREDFGMPASSLPENGIKDDWWNSAWIPITSNGSGDSFCIDLDPTSEGQSGQIIRMWHDVPERELLAPSFGEWITNYVNDLYRGIYEPSNDIGWGGIVIKE
jgi:cell wall assembly regulator SMI1